MSNMTPHGSTSPPALGTPGSLKTVFKASEPRAFDHFDDFVDEILPGCVQTSLLTSSATMGRRSRLDESAGEGLRRNVLLRNAMLSSLERERRQLSEEAQAHSATASFTSTPQIGSPALDEEAQFFEDLLLELSGSETSNSTSTVLEASMQDATAPSMTEEEEDYIELESGLPSEHVFTQLHSRRSVPLSSPNMALASVDRDVVSGSPALASVDSCSSAFSEPRQCDDSGFAEATSCPASAASYCAGYPNVCPYPAISSFAGGSSEELPALIDDDDSDLDEDEDDEADDQLGPAPESAALMASPAAAHSQDGEAMRSPPLSPVASPIHSACTDHPGFRDLLSPDSSRPTSPISSASSKGDADGPSPLLLPSDVGPLPSLAELSLQLPAAIGSDLLALPSRTLTGAWFEHKHEAPSAAGLNVNADRMRWTTSPSTCFRRSSTVSSSMSSSVSPGYRPYRLGVDSDRSTLPFVPANDPSEYSVVVHWSR